MAILLYKVNALRRSLILYRGYIAMQHTWPSYETTSFCRHSNRWLQSESLARISVKSWCVEIYNTCAILANIVDGSDASCLEGSGQITIVIICPRLPLVHWWCGLLICGLKFDQPHSALPNLECSLSLRYILSCNLQQMIHSVNKQWNRSK